MPVSSASQVASRLEKAGGAIRKSQTDAVRRASLALKAGVQSTSPARLRGVGKAGARLGVSFTVAPGANPTAIGRATGPWPLIEYDTKAHLIVPRKRRGRQALAFGGIFRASAHHPGTNGKLVFHKGVAKATPKAVAEMHKVTVNAVREALT